jgi:hypothetical protein
MHPHKAEISPTRKGLTVLGYRVFPDFRRLRDDNGHRFQRRLRRRVARYRAGEITLPELRPGICAWLGHARHADTRGLRRAIFSGLCLQRGTGQ